MPIGKSLMVTAISSKYWYSSAIIESIGNIKQLCFNLSVVYCEMRKTSQPWYSVEGNIYPVKLQYSDDPQGGTVLIYVTNVYYQSTRNSGATTWKENTGENASKTGITTRYNLIQW